MTDLGGKLIAVSISDAPDRRRLGFPDSEIDRVLLSVCASLVRGGARVLYGGNLDPNGYTFKIFRHLAGAYGRHRDQPPFIHLVPDVILKMTSREDFEQMKLEGEGFVESMMVDPLNRIVPASHDIPLSDNPQESLSRMRLVSAEQTDGRVVMGGKMGTIDTPNDTYMGSGPGVVEEALASLRLNKPVAVFGAFGGAARDLAIALGLMDAHCRLKRGPQQDSYEATMKQASKLRVMRQQDPQFSLQSEIASEENAETLANLTVRFLSNAIHRDDARPSRAGLTVIPSPNDPHA